MTHIMVDLETWGLVPGSDIRSIGAVVFDPWTGTLSSEFYVNVVEGERIFGLTRDPETIKWWSEQSENAQTSLEVSPKFIRSALQDFSDWWLREQSTEGGEYARFWANGPSFDEQILSACYRAGKMERPWSYRAPRDMRTICEAAGGVDLQFEGTQHNALDDARHQARCVIAAYRKLRLGEIS